MNRLCNLQAKKVVGVKNETKLAIEELNEKIESARAKGRRNFDVHSTANDAWNKMSDLSFQPRLHELFTQFFASAKIFPQISKQLHQRHCSAKNLLFASFFVE